MIMDSRRVVVGSTHSADTGITAFLGAQGHLIVRPLTREAAVHTLLDRCHVAIDDITLVIGRGSALLRNPRTKRSLVSR